MSLQLKPFCDSVVREEVSKADRELEATKNVKVSRGSWLPLICLSLSKVAAFHLY